MSLDFTGYLRDDQGNAISGATVEAYVVGDASPTSSDTTDAAGLYSITGLAAAAYNLKMTKGTQIRWINSATSFQVTTIYGYNGTDAPLADASIKTSQLQDLAVTAAKIADSGVTTTKIDDLSVTTAKINDSAITTAKIAADAVDGTKIADNSVSDAVIGYRTIDASGAPTLDQDILVNHLSGLAHQIMTITGELDWKTGPADDISSLDSRVTTLEAAYPAQTHSTATNATDLSIPTTGATLATLSSLAAGTWLIIGNGGFVSSNFSSHDLTLKIKGGATTYQTLIAGIGSSTSTHTSAGIMGLVTLGSTTTITITGAGDDTHNINCSAGNFQALAIRVA